MANALAFDECIRHTITQALTATAGNAAPLGMKMNRALNDNALLHIARLSQVDRIYGRIMAAGLYGVAIGAGWFVLVAYRAGVLS